MFDIWVAKTAALASGPRAEGDDGMFIKMPQQGPLTWAASDNTTRGE